MKPNKGQHASLIRYCFAFVNQFIVPTMNHPYCLPLITSFLIFSSSILGFAQTGEVYKRVAQLRSNGRPANASLFEQSTADASMSTTLATEDFVALKLDSDKLADLHKAAPEFLRLSIPAPSELGTWTLELYKANILTPDAQITDSDGKEHNFKPGVFYHGILNGDDNSIASISLFSDEVIGIIASAAGNYDLGRLELGTENEYVLYRSNELSSRIPFNCGTADGDIQPETASSSSTCRVIRVYIECDLDMLNKRGSVANVSSFVTGLFNQAALLYTNEQITTQISQIFVWTSTDPYATLTSSSTILTNFRTNRSTFNGDLAHLLSTRSSGMGGIAYLDVLCSSSFKYAFSNIYNSFNNVPSYSWTVNVFAHEMGHNLGSNHTQWCGWTGGALDNCYTTEGGCAAGPAPIGGGTIMSYCHLVGGVGVNFANGFGVQPGNRMRTRYNNAACISGGTPISVTPSTATICSGGSVSLTASGASSYSWTPTTGLSAGTGATVTANPSTTTTYTVSATANGCTSTATATVTVRPALNYGTLAAGNQSFSGSGDPSAISFSTLPTGGSGSFSYQWYSRSGVVSAPSGTSSSGWTAISGATSNSYNPGVISTSTSFAVMVNPTGTPDCSGAVWASGVRQITISTGSVINRGTLASGNQTFCSGGGNPNAIVFSTSPSGATSFTYQWYFRNGIHTPPTGTSTSGWSVINGATLNSYDPPVVITVSRSYACRVTPAGGSAAFAAGVRQITVLPAFSAGTVSSGDQTFCGSGNPAAINLSSNPTGSGAYQYRWYFKESASGACPTGSSTTGWLTNNTSANISGTSTTGSGLSFDPISAGSLNSGRTFALFITPVANGNTPACGTPRWASNCRKTYVTTCALPGEEEMPNEFEDSEEAPELISPAFPNPARGVVQFRVRVPEHWKDAHFEVFDVHGRRVYQLNLEPGSVSELSWNPIGAGTYFYTLSNSGNQYPVQKLVILP